MADSFEISRADLFWQVWDQPITKLAKQWNLSPQKISAACDANDIPRPSNGYWPQKARGLPIEEQPPLPPSDHQLIMIPISSRKAAPAEVPAIAVPHRLNSPLPAITEALQRLKDRYQNYQNHKGIIDTRSGKVPNIAVTGANLDRAVRLLDTFMRTMTKEGFKFGPCPDEPQQRGRFGILVGKEGYPMRLSERTLRIPIPPADPSYSSWQPTKRVPNGELIFTVGKDFPKPVVITDTKHHKVEDLLGRFIVRVKAHIAQDQEQIQQRELKWARDAADRKEVERHAAEQERLRKAEEERIGRLMEQLQQWRLANEIRAYISSVRKMIDDGGAKITPDGPMDRWLKWAEGYAAEVDPTRAVIAKLREFKRNPEYQLPHDTMGQ